MQSEKGKGPLESLAQPELYVEEKFTESKIPYDAGNPE